MKMQQLPDGFKNPDWLESELRSRPETAWEKLGQQRALALFHAMAVRVPAYKAFLSKHHINHEHIKTIEDFKTIPTIDKDNYLRTYDRKDLCWDGDFKNQRWIISTTSGSTGKPYYFPRQSDQDWQYAVMAEMYLRSNFDIQNKSTLYIVAFPMGAWIGGLFTYEALKIVADKSDYKLSIITPGIHKKEVIEAVKSLGKDFDQIIIGSYAPFLKDILDDGIREGVKWSDYNLGFVFSAEAFSELFRNYVIKKTGLKDQLRGTLNHYGTVDLGTMSHETPLSIMLRRQAMQSLDLYKTLFGREDKVPTFTQYNPALFYFEENDDHGLYCSAFSGLPLVRYDLKDSGEVLGFEEAKKRLAKLGIDQDKLVKEAKITDTVWQLPYVSVYERNDFSVSFYAFQIYPEMIRRPLQDESLEDAITGKFTMLVEFDDSGQQKLQINIELKADREEDEKLREHVLSTIVESLLAESSEYRETHAMYGETVHPDLVFWPYEDVTYFRTGTKQKWVKKG
jgi:phenylacetate-CoA ligase